jgi:acetyl esterase/lipase
MPTLEEIARLPIVYSIAGMEEVGVQKNGVYRTVDGTALPMDVYSPAGGRGPRPVVILVHGGPIPEGTRIKEAGVFVTTGRLLAASGFGAVTFNHRFYGPERVRDADDDVATLVAHVRENAASLRLDAERIALWCYSGGGPLLARWLRERPSSLRALVAYYSILDLQVPPEGVPDPLGEATRRQYSPLCHLGPGERSVPPILVARAGQDHPWLNGGLDRFVSEALARNVPLDLMTHPEGHHGFDILDDTPRSREILRRTVEFLQVRLG